MTQPLPPHPNVRKCTHIKVTGQQCGSPALRGEFFCYFHTRVIKGVQQRVDMQLHSMALLEDAEAIQLSIMYVVDGLVKGTLELPRARLILQALRIAARNAREVRFDDCYYKDHEQKMVREVPDYARQYLIEHPEFGPPIDAKHQRPCGAGALAREAAKTVAQPEVKAEPQPALQNASQESVTTDPATEQRKNAAHDASRGTKSENNPAPEERKKPQRELRKEESELNRVEAAIAGAERGNWRDLRSVLEFAGIDERSKDAPS
jgi:hypothetical protein